MPLRVLSEAPLCSKKRQLKVKPFEKEKEDC